MKKIILTIIAIFMCMGAYSETRNLNWYNGDNAYSQTTCEIGGNLDVPSTAPTKYGYDFVGWDVKSAKELKNLYLRNGAYIDTEVVFDSDEIEYELKMLYPSNLQYSCFFGAAESCSTGTVCNQQNSAGSIGLWYGTGNIRLHVGGMSGQNVSYTYDNNANVYNLYIKKSSRNVIFSVNGEVSRFSLSGTLASNLNIYLGKVNCGTGGSWRCGGEATIYYFRIKKDGVLVRDFVPAIDPNSVVCFYDRVENKFYYNAGGADFVAGPVVE